MKVLYLLICQMIWIGVGIAADTVPNPYQIFAEEQAKVYRIPANRSAWVQGDVLPDLSRRPPALRPGPIPAGVRYSFAADSAMAEAAMLLTNHFCGPAGEKEQLFSRTLVVHPGAWTNLKERGPFGIKSATRWGFLVWDGKVQQKLSGIVLRDRDELKGVEASIRRDVQGAGGSSIRALSSSEMSKWWIFIGFDIQEPTLVLETKDKKQQFIFGFVNNQIVILDELKNLPDFQAPPRP